MRWLVLAAILCALTGYLAALAVTAP